MKENFVTGNGQRNRFIGEPARTLQGALMENEQDLPEVELPDYFPQNYQAQETDPLGVQLPADVLYGMERKENLSDLEIKREFEDNDLPDVEL